MRWEQTINLKTLNKNGNLSGVTQFTSSHGFSAQVKKRTILRTYKYKHQDVTIKKCWKVIFFHMPCLFRMWVSSQVMLLLSIYHVSLYSLFCYQYNSKLVTSCLTLFISPPVCSVRINFSKPLAIFLAVSVLLKSYTDRK